MSIAQGATILIDEPELHLNPAVCRDLLTFMVDAYAVRKDLKIIVCSHSPEILAGALDRDECSLYHLVSEKMLTKVRRNQKSNVYEVLARLGTSESDGLLYKATVFVEGEDDVDLLETGFGELLRRHKLKDLGGRREIEKQIAQLQEAEKLGERMTLRCFIFDRDEAPSKLTSSESVKVLQWQRRCLENYLIDIDILADLLMNKEVVKEPFPNQGEVAKLLRDLALRQLDDFVARNVYVGYSYDDPGLRMQDIQGKPPVEIAGVLFERLAKVQAQIATLDETAWKAKFQEDCSSSHVQLASVWETTWREVCDGKRLFRDLQQQVQMNVPLRRFKMRVMAEMRNKSTENWRSIESLLKGMI